MRKHNAFILTAICMLLTTFCATETHAAGADDPNVISYKGKDGVARQLTDINVFSSPIDEDTGKNELTMSYALLGGTPVVLKCGTQKVFAREMDAVQMLDMANAAPGPAIGKANIALPLDYFKMPGPRFSLFTSQQDCVVYERIPGKNLKDYATQTNLVTIAKTLPGVIKDVLQGVHYMYQANIAHNDLRTPNVMIYSDTRTNRVAAKIIDYDRVVLLVPTVQDVKKTNRFTNLDNISVDKREECWRTNSQVGNMIRDLIFKGADPKENEIDVFLDRILADTTRNPYPNESPMIKKILKDMLMIRNELMQGYVGVAPKGRQNFCKVPLMILNKYAAILNK
ncbi:hypothetical protein BDF22DRAFT_667481 [Syncephalis plumigaleata]|nr:hypothetical protein BDF22DRAFT_667481 [Syncephalis plumigaleata]